MSSHHVNHWREQAVMLGLIVFISLVFVGQLLVGPENYWPLMVVPGNVVAAWDWALAGGGIESMHFVPLLTSALLHGGFDHLLFNMLYLWIFGALAVRLLGSWWMLLVFVITALCGSVFHVVMNADSMVPMLGASGAVMGFEGLYLGMAVRWKLPDPDIWPIAHPVPPAQLAAFGVLGLVMDYMGFLGGNLGVAYSAHLGGFVGGVVLGAFVVPMPRVAEHRA